MAFQPLGYRFEIKSNLQPDRSKAALRKATKGWFEVKNGPRGWIFGPLMCLWMSAFDRHGPMIVATIRQDGFGTKISGRAGADLNGTLMFILLAPVMAWLVRQMVVSGQGSVRIYVLVGVIFGLGLPLTLWINSKDRGEADPIVRFIERTLVPKTAGELKRTQLRTLSRVPVTNGKLTINGSETGGPPSEHDVYSAIANLEQDEFVIVAVASETYMQTAKEYDRFVLEYREGDAGRHYRAEEKLEMDEVIDTMTCYLRDGHASERVAWKRIRG